MDFLGVCANFFPEKLFTGLIHYSHYTFHAVLIASAAQTHQLLYLYCA